jgi:tRNA A-37 threonylcarbamoyl transferase component Bud32
MNTKDSQGHLSVNSMNEIIAKEIKNNPKREIFNIETEGKKVWVKRARKTGSNLLHKIAYMITKNPIVIPVENKTPQKALKFESSKLKLLHTLSIPVPRVIEITDNYFILEDCGPTMHRLISKRRLSNPSEVLEKIITQLTLLHNMDQFHGGSQIKNFTYKDGKIYFIDFEESFSRSIKIEELQFRDLFLFLFSISKLNIEINYENLIKKYINLTKKTDVIEKFHILSSKVNFLMKLIENKTIWNLIDSDTKSVYRLLAQLRNIPSKVE